MATEKDSKGYKFGKFFAEWILAPGVCVLVLLLIIKAAIMIIRSF